MEQLWCDMSYIIDCRALSMMYGEWPMYGVCTGSSQLRNAWTQAVHLVRRSCHMITPRSRGTALRASVWLTNASRRTDMLPGSYRSATWPFACVFHCGTLPA